MKNLSSNLGGAAGCRAENAVSSGNPGAKRGSTRQQQNEGGLKRTKNTQGGE